MRTNKCKQCHESFEAKFGQKKYCLKCENLKKAEHAARHIEWTESRSEEYDPLERLCDIFGV